MILCRSLGNRCSASRQLASSFVVVSLPAMISRKQKPDDLIVGRARRHQPPHDTARS